MTPLTPSQNERLLKGIRETLANVDAVRVPSVADASPPTPPMWIEPRNGVPAPGQTEGLEPTEMGDPVVTALYAVTEIPGDRFEQNIFRRQPVEVWIRARTSPDAFRVDEVLKEQFRDRRNYNLVNGLWISESLVYRGLQRIGPDQSGFTYNTQYIFDIWT